MRSVAVAFASLVLFAGVVVVVPAVAAAEVPEHTDVMLVFDTSGSMSEELAEAKLEIEQVMTHVSATLPDVQFGVAEVRDYSPSAYTEEIEEPGVKPWQLDQPVTSDLAAVKGAIEPLEAFGGGDGPEAYGRALWETDTNPNVGWRSDARHIIILVADNVPHDNDLDEGIPESEWSFEGTPAPWNTGEELAGTWGIPGTIWSSGSNLDFQTVMEQLASDGKPLGMVDFRGTETGYLPYWENWAALSGGEALLGGTGELATKVATLIETRAKAPLPPCPASEVRNGEGECVPAPPPPPTPTSTCAPPQSLSPFPVSLSVIGGQQFQVTVATAADGALPPSDFSAAINWGDGSPSETATVNGTVGNLVVKGTHTYPVPSSRKEYRVVTQIYYVPPGCSRPATPTATINAPADVVPPAVSHSGWKPFEIGSAIFGTTVGGVTCGVGVVGEAPTGGFDTGLTYLGCAATVAGAVSVIPAIEDPPDYHFSGIFAPRPFPIPAVPRKCKSLSRSACSQLMAAERQYLTDAASVASISEAVGVTANRFGGAVSANNVPGEELQRHAEARYLPMQQRLGKREKSAARLLGRDLRHDHLNTTYSSEQVARGRAAFIRLHGVPGWLTSRLERSGIISGVAELKAELEAYIAKAPKPKKTRLASILG